MTQGDKNFDQLAARLKHNIYSSDKGTVRLSVLKYDMLAGISAISQSKPLNVLDAGGGMGQIARWLAKHGHQVTLCDLSAEMLNLAAEENAMEQLTDRIQLIHAPLQELPQLLSSQKFDLIILHGVIEWMADPCSAIEILRPMLKSDGAMSILFFNRNKLILKWGINGQIGKALSGKPANSRPLTPQNPLTEADLLPTITAGNLKITSKAGIRIFYGFFAKLTKKLETSEETISLEQHYCHTEPFASMGEHTHIVLRSHNSNDCRVN